MNTLPPLSLYLHFPWCISKCPYCDFNSHSLNGELPADAYIDALLQDLESVAAAVADRPVVSVFLGGGTPSLFSPAHLKRLLSAVERHLQLATDAEITMEANPGAVEHAAFAAYRAAGINRLSLGAQSFADQQLGKLGRIHTSQDVRNAFAEARAAGFRNINLDLMYALPDQTVAEALNDVDAAIALGPEHISWYHLTLEPNTVFYARPPALPDDEASWEMQLAGAERLTAAAYHNYEVSAWSRPEHVCRHNLNYWQYGDYLGLGAGAHGKLTDAAGCIVRTVRAAHPRAYMTQVAAGKPPLSSAVVAATDTAFEFMLNVLRLRDGFSLELFARRTGLPAGLLAAGLDEARARGLLEMRADDRLVPSPQGWHFLDDLQAIFLPRD